MEKTGVQKLARVLKILVTLVFICNLLVLALVPGLAGMRGAGPYEAAGFWQYLWRVWREGSYTVVLTLFLLFCGGCTAVLLWQGRRVLSSICRENPFCMDNARSMRRAAVCCFLIAAAALVRMVWGFAFYRSLQPLLTYNALFCPTFLLAGLLCMVMSALFRQAAQLKEENDLTI